MLIELCRLGADAELKYTPGGDPVAELRLAYDVRVKNETRTQWVTASLWGKRAETVAQHLTKGKQLMVTMESPYVRKWDKGDGYSMMTRIIDFKFAGAKEQGGDPAPQQQDYRGHPGSSQASPTYDSPRRERAPVQSPPAGFDNFDDDIPF